MSSTSRQYCSSHEPFETEECSRNWLTQYLLAREHYYFHNSRSPHLVRPPTRHTWPEKTTTIPNAISDMQVIIARFGPRKHAQKKKEFCLILPHSHVSGSFFHSCCQDPRNKILDSRSVVGSVMGLVSILKLVMTWMTPTVPSFPLGKRESSGRTFLKFFFPYLVCDS